MATVAVPPPGPGSAVVDAGGSSATVASSPVVDLASGTVVDIASGSATVDVAGVVASSSSRARASTGVDKTALIGLLGYGAAIMVGLLAELGRVADWSAGPQLAFAGLLLFLSALPVPVLVMAAFHKRLDVSAACAKLAAVILTGLFVVAISTRFGRWGNLAALPFAVVVAGVMTGVWLRFAPDPEEEEKGE